MKKKKDFETYGDKKLKLYKEMWERIKDAIIQSDVHIKGKLGFRVSDDAMQDYYEDVTCDCYGFYIDEMGILNYIDMYNDTYAEKGIDIKFMDIDSLACIADYIEDLIATRDKSFE